VSPPANEREVDYGNDAVERPAERALEYGDRAVDNAVIVAQAPQTKKPSARPAPATTNRVTVNPNSKVSGPTLLTALRGSPLPKALKEKIRFDRQSRSLTLPAASNVSQAKGSEWVADLLKIGNDWEVTTARLVVIVDNQQVRGQRLEPDLQDEEERGRISGGDDLELMPAAADFHGAGPGILLGKTVPNLRMSDQSTMTEIVRLSSNRGLVIIVREIVVRKGDQETLDPVNVPMAVMTKNLIHELAAHAGLFSQGLPAGHGNTRVERNTTGVDDLYKASLRKQEETLRDDVQVLIEAMQKHQ
jgi:hypothetical protein